MKLKVVVHEAEEGGYWAEVPAIPGCATQAESFEELLSNLHEAVEGCLSVDVRDVPTSPGDRVVEIAESNPSAANAYAACSRGGAGSGCASAAAITSTPQAAR